MQIPTYTEPSFNLIPPGIYRARISSLVWDVSKKGNTMLVIDFKISGQKSTIRHWLVWNTDTPADTNRSNFFFKKFCNAFNLNPAQINQQGFSLNQWVNAEGGVRITHRLEQSTGITYPRIEAFLPRSQYDFLPPFSDPIEQKKISDEIEKQNNQFFNNPQNFQNQSSVDFV